MIEIQLEKSSVIGVRKELLDGNSSQQNQMLSKTGKITEISILLALSIWRSLATPDTAMSV